MENYEKILEYDMEVKRKNLLKYEKKAIILCGVPASGKSTLAESYKDMGFFVLSKDDCRSFMLLGEVTGKKWDNAVEKYTDIVFFSRLEQALNIGLNIVIDNTTTTLSTFNAVFDPISYNDYSIRVIVLNNVNLGEILERDSKREFPVGKAIITRKSIELEGLIPVLKKIQKECHFTLEIRQKVSLV